MSEYTSGQIHISKVLLCVTQTVDFSNGIASADKRCNQPKNQKQNMNYKKAKLRANTSWFQLSYEQ